MKAIFLIGMCAWAQVETPRIGMMLDSRGSMRPVYGVASSVTIGDPVEDGVVAMACRKECMTSAEPELIAFEGETAFESKVDALSMRVVAGVREFAIRGDNGVSIRREDGGVVGSIPDATGAVMLLDRGVLFAAGDETVLRRDDGSETRFAIRADAFFAMSEGYVQIRSSDSNYALRLRGAKLFQLPEPGQ